MGDTTVIKVDSKYSPKGSGGQIYLASGKNIAMRLWDEGPNTHKPENVARDYETVGYVLEGSGELEVEGQTVHLKAGDSWIVPKGAHHTYKISDRFKAVEATYPPYHIHGRDE
jgi:mannose-6-phosphate isomerase-like protein (cupin superfamily)